MITPRQLGENYYYDSLIFNNYFYQYSNAYRTVFTTIIIISCFFHVVKNLRNQASIVVGGRNYIEESILPIVRELSRAPNEVAFNKLSNAACEKWEKEGQAQFSKYFREVYLSQKWKNWYVGSLPNAGIGITNNPMESLNHLIKLLVF